MTTKAHAPTPEAEDALRKWGDQMQEQANARYHDAAEHETAAEAARAEGDSFRALYDQAQEALANLAAYKAGKKAK